jgi:hypothetical protein
MNKEVKKVIVAHKVQIETIAKSRFNLITPKELSKFETSIAKIPADTKTDATFLSNLILTTYNNITAPSRFANSMRQAGLL